MANGRPLRPRRDTVQKDNGRRAKGRGTYNFRNLPVVAPPKTPKSRKAAQRNQIPKKKSTKKVAKPKRETCIINGMVCPMISPELLKLKPKSKNYFAELLEFIKKSCIETDAASSSKPKDKAKDIEKDSSIPRERSPSVVVLSDNDDEEDNLGKSVNSGMGPEEAPSNQAVPLNREQSQNSVTLVEEVMNQEADQGHSSPNAESVSITVSRAQSPAPSDSSEEAQELPAAEDIDDLGLNIFYSYLFDNKGSQSPETMEFERVLETTAGQDPMTDEPSGDASSSSTPQEPSCSNSLLPSPAQKMTIDYFIEEMFPVQVCSSEIVHSPELMSSTVLALPSSESSPGVSQPQEPCCSSSLLPSPNQEIAILPNSSAATPVQAGLQDLLTLAPDQPAQSGSVEQRQLDAAASLLAQLLPASRKPGGKRKESSGPVTPVKASFPLILATLNSVSKVYPEGQEPIQTLGDLVEAQEDIFSRTSINFNSLLPPAPSTSSSSSSLSNTPMKDSPPSFPSSTVQLPSCPQLVSADALGLRSTPISPAKDMIEVGNPPAPPASKPLKKDSSSSTSSSLEFPSFDLSAPSSLPKIQTCSDRGSEMSNTAVTPLPSSLLQVQSSLHSSSTSSAQFTSGVKSLPAVPASTPSVTTSWSTIDDTIAAVASGLSTPSRLKYTTSVFKDSSWLPVFQTSSDEGLKTNNIDLAPRQSSYFQHQYWSQSVPTDGFGSKPALAKSVQDIKVEPCPTMELTPQSLPIPISDAPSASATPSPPENTPIALSTTLAQDVVEIGSDLPAFTSPTLTRPLESTPSSLPIPIISSASPTPSPLEPTPVVASSAPPPPPRRASRFTEKAIPTSYRQTRKWEKSTAAHLKAMRVSAPSEKPFPFTSAPIPPPIASQPCSSSSLAPTAQNTTSQYPPGREKWRQELCKLRVGSRKFVNKFIEGEHLYLQNQDVPVHVWADGTNYRDKIGNFDGIHKFESKVGLGLKFPNMTFNNIFKYISKSERVSVINSTTRKSKWMIMEKLIEQFTDEEQRGPDPLNVLSKEVSRDRGKLRLSSKIRVPDFVRENCIIQELEGIVKQKIKDLKKGRGGRTSPEVVRLQKHLEDLPRYQKFLLLSMKRSYTDAHVDFSSTSVSYHVKEGIKVFYVAPGTPENIEIYKEDEMNEDPNKEWIFNRLFDQWRRVVIKAGETAFIPAGWLHAVYTPMDSIVFGGNFLMKKFLEEQFDLTRMEEIRFVNEHLPEEEMFQGFRNVMWMFMEHSLLPDLRKAIGQPEDELVKMGRLFLENMDPEYKIHNDFYTTGEKNLLLGELYNLLKVQPSTSSSCVPSTSPLPSTSTPIRKRAHQEDYDSSDAPPKRGRGRPRKIQLSQPSTTPESANPPVKRGRGRPRKII